MKKLIALVLVFCTVFAFCACGEAKEAAPAASAEAAAPAEPPKVSGSFSATAKGMGGDVTVTLTFTEDAITDCTAEGKKETPKYGGAALEALTEAVKTDGKIGVDVVSGATETSEAFLSAAEECVTKAGLNPGDYK